MKALVVGRGASGAAAARLVEGRGGSVESADGVDVVVVSPGVRTMSELEFGCRELKRLGVKMLAVTGSKGKSSVVKLVADALNLAGFSATPCGNYGLPVSELALSLQSAPGTSVAGAQAPSTSSASPSAITPQWAVVEVSSFMMETTNLPEGTFERAVVLNLQEDHLDRHGSVRVYHALKLKLLASAKSGEDFSKPAAAAAFSAGDRALLGGSYFDNDVLASNGLAALSLMRAAGVDDETARRAFREFVPLPHRMNEVGVFGGVRCVDDSKATSVAALAAGVGMAGRRVRLIAGGRPKGDDPKTARRLLTDRVKKVYLIGESADAFSAAWSGAVDCEVCGTMERAVAKAMREAVAGETLLLSPGAASYDQFKNFGQRGDVFAELVKKEGKCKT